MPRPAPGVLGIRAQAEATMFAFQPFTQNAEVATRSSCK
jgi:hypothetical protein